MEYLEKYKVIGDDLKEYIKHHNTQSNLFAKIYLKTNNNVHFLNKLKENNINSFSYTSNKKMLIGVVSDKNMSNLKKQLLDIWGIYRSNMKKNKFNLGKQ